MSSLNEMIDAWDLAAEIRMLRQSHRGAVLLVEGEFDSIVFERIVDKVKCLVVVGFGKENIIGALDLLEEDGFPGIIGIVDADFDRVLGKDYELNGLYLTDNHDLEIDLLDSRCGAALIERECGVWHINEHFGGDCRLVLTFLLERLAPLSVFKLHCIESNLNISFKEIPIDYLEGDLSIDIRKMIDRIVFNRRFSDSDKDGLATQLEAKLATHMDLRQISNGHDVLFLLSVALRGKLSSRSNTPDCEDLSHKLANSASAEEIMHKGFFESLRRWSENNPKYSVL